MEREQIIAEVAADMAREAKKGTLRRNVDIYTAMMVRLTDRGVSGLKRSEAENAFKAARLALATA